MIVAKFPRSTKRRDLVNRLRELGWDGPYQGTGPHPEFMAKDTRVLKLPNVHSGDIRIPLLKTVLDQAGITKEVWLGEETQDGE